MNSKFLSNFFIVVLFFIVCSGDIAHGYQWEYYDNGQFMIYYYDSESCKMLERGIFDVWLLSHETNFFSDHNKMYFKSRCLIDCLEEKLTKKELYSFTTELPDPLFISDHHDIEKNWSVDSSYRQLCRLLIQKCKSK